MTGLEKMKSQILEEAKELAQSKLSQAKKQAEEILETAKADAKKTAEGISQKSVKDVANYKERVASSIDLQKRTKILAAKQEMIAEVLRKAYETLQTMEAGMYFDIMMKMLEKYVLPQEGEICFSPADLERMPATCKEKIAQIAEEKGGSLKISKEGKPIESGFVLVYGGVEENCTLQAMFDAKREDLSDEIRRLLFS